MPAQRKRLVNLVHDRTFLARRHADRLLEDLLPDHYGELSRLQGRYQAEASELERRQLALDFQHAVRMWSRAGTLDEQLDEALARIDHVGDGRISDLSGESIAPGTGAVVRVVYHDAELGVWDLDVTTTEAGELSSHGWKARPTVHERRRRRL